MHVLPKGFVRIRYFGLLGNRDRQAKLRRCRELLGVTSERRSRVRESFEGLLERLTGMDLSQCPVCGVGRMVRKRELDPLGQASGWRAWSSGVTVLAQVA